MIDDAGLDRLARALLEELRSARRIGIFGETTPDPDCFGSQLALSRFAKELNPKAKVLLYADGGCPLRLRFLSGWKAFRAPKDGERPVDLAIFVDGGIERCGAASRRFAETCPRHVLVDHHAVGSQATYALEIVDPERASTTELIAALVRRWPCELDSVSASALYLGLMADTGSFRYSSTRAESLRTAAELVEAGARPDQLAEAVMLERPFAWLTVLGRVLPRVRRELDGRVLVASVSRRDWSDLGLAESPEDWLLSQLTFLEGVEVVVYLKGGEPVSAKPWRRLSFRSRGAVDVAALARELDPEGGGHIRASGCRLVGSDPEIQDRILTALKPKLAGSGG